MSRDCNEGDGHRRWSAAAMTATTRVPALASLPQLGPASLALRQDAPSPPRVYRAHLVKAEQIGDCCVATYSDGSIEIACPCYWEPVYV